MLNSRLLFLVFIGIFSSPEIPLFLLLSCLMPKFSRSIASFLHSSKKKKIKKKNFSFPKKVRDIFGETRPRWAFLVSLNASSSRVFPIQSFFRAEYSRRRKAPSPPPSPSRPLK